MEQLKAVVVRSNLLTRISSSIVTPRRVRAALLGLGWLSTTAACVSLSKHEQLRNAVVKLEQQSAERGATLEEAVARADEQLAVLEQHVAEAEKVLRSSQAGTGVRVENMEADLAELRGQTDELRIETDSATRGLSDVRSEFDERINRLENKVQAATEIPEGKSELFTAANQALEAKDYPKARRYFRTYLTRYPKDKQAVDVRFKIGLTLYNEGDYASALGEFHWIKKNGQRSKVLHDALYYLGLSFAKTGQCKNAKAYFEYLSKRGSKAPKRYRAQAKKQIELLEGSAAELCNDGARTTGTRPG